MKTVELASRILTQLGFYQEPSRELGVDDRRDNIVHLIEEYTTPQTKPLSDEEILDLCPPNHSDLMNEAYTIDFARAIEERHGIK